MRLPASLLLLACLAGCGEPRVEGDLDGKARFARLQACNRLWRLEDFDAVTRGPGGGSVDQVAFDDLGPAKQRRLAELIACQRSLGAVEPMTIEFYVPGRNLKRIAADNDIDFASQL